MIHSYHRFIGSGHLMRVVKCGLYEVYDIPSNRQVVENQQNKKEVQNQTT